MTQEKKPGLKDMYTQENLMVAKLLLQSTEDLYKFACLFAGPAQVLHAMDTLALVRTKVFEIELALLKK
jgi:hypothetical protein